MFLIFQTVLRRFTSSALLRIANELIVAHLIDLGTSRTLSRSFSVELPLALCGPSGLVKIEKDLR